MMTTRALTPDGLGDKTNLERENKWLAGQGLPLTQVQLVEIRQAWEQVANVHLARAELDQKIDSRSHAERGLEIEPTLHMGVHATQMERRGKEVSQRRLDPESARRNAELIREKPEQVFAILTGEKSVFDRRDVARTLHRYIDEPEAFQAAFSKVMASPALVELQAEQKDFFGRIFQGARYSTREMVSVERGMAESADRMAGRPALASTSGASKLLWRRGRFWRKSSARRCGMSPGASAWPPSSGWPARENPPCFRPRAKLGKRRGLPCMARLCPARRPKGWRNLPASRRAPWRRGSMAGPMGARPWGRATCS